MNNLQPKAILAFLFSMLTIALIVSPAWPIAVGCLISGAVFGFAIHVERAKDSRYEQVVKELVELRGTLNSLELFTNSKGF